MGGLVKKKSRKKPITTNTMIRSALRMLFLRSRERAQAMKDANYTCAQCGKKQSRAKGKEIYVEVHHLDGVDWSGLFDEIRRRLLHTSDRYQVLCKECHGGTER
jgi:hypothetical protein